MKKLILILLFLTNCIGQNDDFTNETIQDPPVDPTSPYATLQSVPIITDCSIENIWAEYFTFTLDFSETVINEPVYDNYYLGDIYGDYFIFDDPSKFNDPYNIENDPIKSGGFLFDSTDKTVSPNVPNEYLGQTVYVGFVLRSSINEIREGEIIGLGRIPYSEWSVIYEWKVE